jgi:hypothetical protein
VATQQTREEMMVTETQADLANGSAVAFPIDLVFILFDILQYKLNDVIIGYLQRKCTCGASISST